MLDTSKETATTVADEGFYYGKRLVFAQEFPAVPDSDLPFLLPIELTPASPEFLRVDNFLSMVVPPEKQEEMLMVAARLALHNASTSQHLEEKAQEQRLTHLLPSSTELSEYWEVNEPQKKCCVRNYLRPGHQLSDHQTLYVDVQANSFPQNSDLIFRSSCGEVLLKVTNCPLHNGESKLHNKLKNLCRSDTFCVFINKHPWRTLDLEYFCELAKQDVEFLYLHIGYQPRKECLAESNETLLHNFVHNPKIFVFRWKQHTVMGSKAALSLFREGRLDEVLAKHESILAEQNALIEEFAQREGEGIRISELKLSLMNLLKKNASHGIKPNLQHSIAEVITYCMKEIRKLQDMSIDPNNKTDIGHFAVKLKHCKECRVCVKRYNEWVSQKKKQSRSSSAERPRKKKSKYQCEECSQREGKPVALCVTCFKEYHFHMEKYSEIGARPSMEYSSLGLEKMMAKQEGSSIGSVKLEESVPTNLDMVRRLEDMQSFVNSLRNYRPYLGLMMNLLNTIEEKSMPPYPNGKPFF